MRSIQDKSRRYASCWVAWAELQGAQEYVSEKPDHLSCVLIILASAKTSDYACNIARSQLVMVQGWPRYQTLPDTQQQQ